MLLKKRQTESAGATKVAVIAEKETSMRLLVEKLNDLDSFLSSSLNDTSNVELFREQLSQCVAKKGV